MECISNFSLDGEPNTYFRGKLIRIKMKFTPSLQILENMVNNQ